MHLFQDSKNDKNLKKDLDFFTENSNITPKAPPQNLSEILFDNLKESDRKKALLEDDDFLSSFKGFEDSDTTKKLDTNPFDDDESRDSSDTRVETEDEDIILSRSGKQKVSLSSDLSGIGSPVVSESAPSSPASTHFGDESESDKIQRTWKQAIRILWNDIAAHKYASIFLKPILEEKVPGYHSIVYRLVYHTYQTINYAMFKKIFLNFYLFFLIFEKINN